MAGRARGHSLKRTLRSKGGMVLRRLRMLPSGMPDGLGEDEKLLGRTLPYEVMVFFADTPEALYQIEQWYETFRALDERHPVVIFLRDSRTARAVRAGSGLPCYVIAHSTTIDDLLQRSPFTLCLYVNHNPENFGNLRYGQMAHASLMHGDSDKTVTVSNQTKAYDFSFVAGQAGVDRMATYSMFYDAAAKCLPVGRPQVDEQLRRMREYRERRDPKAPPTVLYAPTWEGGQPSGAYSSVVSHGEELVGRLLDTGRYRIVYRPHPLTGVRIPEYGTADSRIRALLDGARGGGEGGAPGAGGTPEWRGRVDVGIDIAESFAEADIMICDISGVAMDWLPSGRPLIVTRPVSPEVPLAETRLTRLVPSLPASGLGDVVALVEEQLTADPLAEARRELTEYYLGDVSPGAATRRFVEACEHIMALRAEALAQRAATTAADRKV